MEKISVNLTKTKSPVYFIDEKVVKDIVKRSNPSNKIGDLDLPALEKKLNNLSSVDSANVYLNLNGNLNLDIKQRVPAFRINKEGNNFYVDEKGNEFPTSKNYSFPCMLVRGPVEKSEYKKLAELIGKIDRDEFSKKYFIGVSKEKDSYNLLTSDGFYKIEIGDLDRIDMKVKGFKTFVEKYLIDQNPEKYSKISVKYENQIVTTLNPNYKENDSIINIGNRELAKLPVIAEKKANAVKKTNTASEKKETPKPAVKKIPVKPKPIVKKEVKTTEKKASKPKTIASEKKPKAKVKIE